MAAAVSSTNDVILMSVGARHVVFALCLAVLAACGHPSADSSERVDSTGSTTPSEPNVVRPDAATYELVQKGVTGGAAWKLYVSRTTDLVCQVMTIVPDDPAAAFVDYIDELGDGVEDPGGGAGCFDPARFAEPGGAFVGILTWVLPSGEWLISGGVPPDVVGVRPQFLGANAPSEVDPVEGTVVLIEPGDSQDPSLELDLRDGSTATCSVGAALHDLPISCGP
jgi:hypothetical protein